MSAWGRVLHTTDKVTALADPTLAWLDAAGLSQDRAFPSPLHRGTMRTHTWSLRLVSKVGFGKRASRFAAIIDDLKVRAGAFSFSPCR